MADRNQTSNKLCASCRRHCKQLSSAVIARCPRYYPGPQVRHKDWKQLEFRF